MVASIAVCVYEKVGWGKYGREGGRERERERKMDVEGHKLFRT
jgi:hypothetical protein